MAKQKVLEKKRRVVAKVTHMEVTYAKSLNYEEAALITAMGRLSQAQEDFWKMIAKDYEIDPKAHNYRIDHKTRELFYESFDFEEDK